MKVLYVIIILCLTNTCFAQKIKSDLEKENLKGNVLSVTTTQRDTITAKIINREIKTYNKDGNLVSKIYYDSLFKGDTTSIRTYYEYSNHQLVRSVIYHKSMKSAVISTYTYRAAENEVEERMYVLDTYSLIGSIVSKYDALGNLTKRIAYDEHNHMAMQTFYKYSRGNIVSEEWKPVNAAAYTINMAYDAMDNKMSEATTDAKGRAHTIIYHYFNYDKQFNWQSMDEPDQKGWITKRVIIYYK